ncbi:MAG: HDOD domain-containing protein [Ramlibacter sp.]
MTLKNLTDLMALDLALPVVPAAMARVIQAFDAPNPSTEVLARDIADDPVLTMHLLRTANSAYFGLGRTVVTPLDAVRVLGFDKVRSLAIAMALKSCFHNIEERKLSAVWTISLNAADVAMGIGNLIGVDRGTAYTAGLLHAVGMLVMTAAMPDAMRALDDLSHPMAPARVQLEQSHFGYSYAQAGAVLLRHWGLPTRFVEAVENQFAPLDNDHHEILAAVTCLAGWRARGEFCGLNDADMATSYPDEVGLLLDLDPDMMLAGIPGQRVRTTVLADD